MVEAIFRIHENFSHVTVLSLSSAPLSGPLVIAEALGSRKGSTKNLKGKMKKERYLFKRREEPVDFRPHQFNKGQASSSSSLGQTSATISPGQATASINQGQASSSSTYYVFQKRAPSASSQVNATKVESPADFGVTHMDQAPAHSTHDKKDAIWESKDTIVSDVAAGPANMGGSDMVRRGVFSEEIDVVPPPLQQDRYQGQIARSELPSPVDAKIPVQNTRIGTDGKVKKAKALKRSMGDLASDNLALNPYHGRERNRPQIVMKFFLAFRSLKNAHNLPQYWGFENLPSENVRVLPSVSYKTSSPPNDPSKAGRNKLKKINDLKSLAAEKKANGKETVAALAPAPPKPVRQELKPVKQDPKVVKQDPKPFKLDPAKKTEPSARCSDTHDAEAAHRYALHELPDSGKGRGEDTSSETPQPRDAEERVAPTLCMASTAAAATAAARSGGRGHHVKFLLGRGKHRGEQTMVANRNFNNHATSIADAGSTSVAALEFNSKNFQKTPHDIHHTEVGIRHGYNNNTLTAPSPANNVPTHLPPFPNTTPAAPPPANPGFNHKMLSLMNRAEDIVTRVKNYYICLTTLYEKPCTEPGQMFLSYMDKGVFGAFGIYSMIKSWNADIEPQKASAMGGVRGPIGWPQGRMRRGQARPGVASEKTKIQ
ncbi:hypothetical protein AAG906_017069 [Vitis piasezkii]